MQLWKPEESGKSSVCRDHRLETVFAMLRGKKVCPLFLLVNLSVCLFLCPMPQGCLNIQVKKWKTHFPISSTPLHISVPRAFDCYATVWEKKAFLWLIYIFLSSCQKNRMTILYFFYGVWSVFALQTCMITAASWAQMHRPFPWPWRALSILSLMVKAELCPLICACLPPNSHLMSLWSFVVKEQAYFHH